MVELIKSAIAGISEKLGYEFSNLEIILEALTHSSYLNEHDHGDRRDNERLEFLGDAILDVIVGDYLFVELPDIDEGELSNNRARIINEKSLAQLARLIDLGNYILLGKGEELNNGRDRDSILSNAFEAVFAAIFKDSGYYETEKVFINLFKCEMDHIISSQELFYDYKSKIYEIAQQHNLGKTEFVISEDKHKNNKVFDVELFIDGKLFGSGHGENKKTAEQEASKEALHKMESEYVKD